MSAADALVKRIDEIMDLYEQSLRDADSPLVATVERWQEALGQAETILNECVNMLGGTVEDHSDAYVLTRELGIRRARQQVLITDSIRAGILLWRSAVPVFREILVADGPAGYERLTDLLVVLHDAISFRLYVGSMAHEHSRMANESLSSAGDSLRLPRGSELQIPSRPENITVREWQILEGVSRALSNHEIAKELALGESTVKTHLRKVFHKLGATSRVDAINKVGLGSPARIKF